MENLPDKKQPQQSLQKLSTNTIHWSSDGDAYLSLYDSMPEPLSGKTVARELARLAKAFPHLEVAFFDILSEEIKSLGMKDQQFVDAVSYVIRNIEWPKVSNILSYDRLVRLYSYNEMCDMVCNNGYSQSQFFFFNKLWGLRSDAHKKGINIENLTQNGEPAEHNG